MIACVQRVKKASLFIDNKLFSQINNGYYLLLCVEKEDNTEKCINLAKKICNIKLFPDGTDKMNLSIKDIHGEILCVSQFTLAADCSKGNKPDFGKASSAEEAKKLYEQFTNNLRAILGIKNVAMGVFGANMTIESINDGPVTVFLKR